MRNKYGGPCYRCGQWVRPGEGHFEKVRDRGSPVRWRTQHAECAIAYRNTQTDGRAKRPATVSEAEAIQRENAS